MALDEDILFPLHEEESDGDFLESEALEESFPETTALQTLPYLEEERDAIESENSQRKAISATLPVPGHGLQYKATLVRLMNEYPKLSNDRQVRVRQTSRTSRNCEKAEAGSVEADRNMFSLFDDVMYKKVIILVSAEFVE